MEYFRSNCFRNSWIQELKVHNNRILVSLTSSQLCLPRYWLQSEVGSSLSAAPSRIRCTYYQMSSLCRGKGFIACPGTDFQGVMSLPLNCSLQCGAGWAWVMGHHGRASLGERGWILPQRKIQRLLKKCMQKEERVGRWKRQTATASQAMNTLLCSSFYQQTR